MIPKGRRSFGPKAILVAIASVALTLPSLFAGNPPTKPAPSTGIIDLDHASVVTIPVTKDSLVPVRVHRFLVLSPPVRRGLH